MIKLRKEMGSDATEPLSGAAPHPIRMLHYAQPVGLVIGLLRAIGRSDMAGCRLGLFGFLLADQLIPGRQRRFARQVREAHLKAASTQSIDKTQQSHGVQPCFKQVFSIGNRRGFRNILRIPVVVLCAFT